MTGPSDQPRTLYEASLAKKRSRLGVIDALEYTGEDKRLPTLRLLAEVDLELTWPGSSSGRGEPVYSLDEQIDFILTRV